MRFNSKTSAALMGSVCAAALWWSSVAGADPVEPNISMIDYRLDLDLDYVAVSLNMSMSEGALGASNLEIDQTALALLDNAAGRIDAGNFLAINQEQLTFNDYEYGDIAQIALNLAASATTQLESELGGNQVAVASFNTATFDVAGEDGTGTIALIQSLTDGNTTNGGLDNAEVSVNLIAGNFMDVATTYAGTAVIDAEVANPDYLAVADRGEGYDTLTPETINGLQQAAVSLNTVRGTADDGTTAQIDLFGQVLDTTALYDFDPENAVTENYDTTFLASASNQAMAYSPRPADTRFVDPALVNGLNDPKVSNLDQVAAISLNTISLGATDGTADFVVFAQNENDESLLSSASDTLYGADWGYAQVASFTDTDEFDSNDTIDGGLFGKELFLSNTAVATTYVDTYEDFASYDPESPISIGADAGEYAGDEDDYADGLGNVGLEDLSQVAALTINSISQAGEGSLTLKAGMTEGIEFTNTAFVQVIEGLNIDAEGEYGSYTGDYVFGKAGTEDSDGPDNGPFDLANGGASQDSYTGAINAAWAETNDGDVTVDTVSQTLQLGLNGISSKGDLNGWNDDDGVGIVQGYDVSIDLQFGNELYAYNSTDEDSTVSVSTVDQVFNLSLNTVSAAGDMTANLSQEPGSTSDDYALDVNLVDDANQFDVGSEDVGDVSVDDISQIASLRVNSVAVTGDIDSYALHQHLDLGGFYNQEGLNDFSVDTNYGDASADGVEQVAMVNLNAVSGADIDAGLEQTAENLRFLQNVNDLDVDSNYAGDASLANASQVSVLNVNNVAASGVLSGSVSQESIDNVAVSIFDGGPTNYAGVYADQDMNGLRNVGGNASIDGLLQTASYNVNTISAAGLSNADISQTLTETYSIQFNFAGVDAEWGVASATGVAQTAINRANYMSISAPVVPE